MKRILLITLIFSGINFSFGQQQIGNSDFENWEAVAGDEEPVNWNSFLTAQGTWSGAAANQIESSSDVRPGSTGTKSCRIWSRDAIFTIANGNVTLGRINMGSTSPTNPANHNISLTANPDFSETLTDQPDSIVFWAKFTPNGGSGNARMKATLHDTYDYRDPEDAAASTHVIATAVLNYPSTGGNWVRFSVPFNYSGPACGNTHILVTFTTNETPGGGDEDDQVWIDDVELIYSGLHLTDSDGDGVSDMVEMADGTNECDACSFVLANQNVAPDAAWLAADCDSDGVSNGDEVVAGTDPLVQLTELSKGGFVVAMDNSANFINVYGKDELTGNYTVYNAIGQEVQTGAIASKIKFEKEFGIYFVHIATENGVYTFEILKN